jgi:hypothetical protein
MNYVMLFKEIIVVYAENHTKSINTKCRVTDSTHRYQWDVTG